MRVIPVLRRRIVLIFLLCCIYYAIRLVFMSQLTDLVVVRFVCGTVIFWNRLSD